MSSFVRFDLLLLHEEEGNERCLWRNAQAGYLFSVDGRYDVDIDRRAWLASHRVRYRAADRAGHSCGFELARDYQCDMDRVGDQVQTKPERSISG